MDMQLRSNADQPYGQGQAVRLQIVDDEEHPAVNWVKLILLIFSTYGLVAVMWIISTSIETMHGSVYQSWTDAGGLFLGLFIFYLLAFGGAWCWGFRQREDMKRQVVEKQIARQKAQQAMRGNDEY